LTSPTTIPRNWDIFKQVNDIPFPDVLKVYLGEEPRRNKTPCPFHLDKTPSFHVYADGWKCYGCGEHGDNVSFVAKLLELRPIDAAKLIARDFGIPIRDRPLSREERALIARKRDREQQNRQLRKAFAKWCKEAQERARALAEGIRSVLEEYGIDIDDDLLPMVHLLPWLEWVADILQDGTEDEKVELFKDERLRRWIGV